MLNGILNIYKEKGFTSHDVVAKARGILRERKIGHTGTLDPDAEGVLPLCIGKATKVVPYLTDADKCYEATVKLGAYTTTEDASGEILETFDVNVTRSHVEEVVKSFEGPYTQTPPMYSAIKVNGVRLYELARKGIVVDRPSRDVYLTSCNLIEWIDDTTFKIRVDCSKGTYIRTLCTDIGRALGCGAYMEYLLRVRVGHYCLEDSLTLGALESHKHEIDKYIEPVEEMFGNYPKITILHTYNKYLYNGNALPFKSAQLLPEQLDQFVRIYDEEGTFRGIYKVNNKLQQFIVEKLFI
ncbi:MAG: tRNA pseudouridine(55) synthase TruB [Clostridiales bacterium]|nr:tRNA pseudouridine(55) synthase TruB [Clostridiales bacterium]